MGLPGRAYPLEVVLKPGDTQGGEQGWIGALAQVLWRVEVEGRPPYEFQDSLDNPRLDPCLASR